VARIEREESCRASGYDDICRAISWHFTTSSAFALLGFYNFFAPHVK